MRLASILLVATALAPLPGCCSLARLFCGPDRTEWISVDYSTPEFTTKTLLEALRRDNPEEVYHCLSQGFRQRNQIDRGAFLIAWDKVREQTPGLHVAGYAEVPAANRDKDGNRAHVTLDIEGNRLDLDLVCERKWEVRYRRPNGTEGKFNDVVGSAEQVLRSKADETERRSTVTLAPMQVTHQGLDEIPPSTIEFAGYVTAWKIDALAMPKPAPDLGSDG